MALFWVMHTGGFMLFKFFIAQAVPIMLYPLAWNLWPMFGDKLYSAEAGLIAVGVFVLAFTAITLSPAIFFASLSALLTAFAIGP